MLWGCCQMLSENEATGLRLRRHSQSTPDIGTSHGLVNGAVFDDCVSRSTQLTLGIGGRICDFCIVWRKELTQPKLCSGQKTT